MYSLLRVFMAGMFISFLGTLPLGSLNIAAMQVSIEEQVKSAAKFALGVALVEVLYVRVSLQAIHWVTAHQAIFRTLEWITVVLFVVLAASSFLTARRKTSGKKSLLLNNSIPRFWLGFGMSAINPVQIPFWFIWSTHLVSTQVLTPSGIAYNSYTAGIGLGTLGGLALFIFCGRWMVNKINAGQGVVNMVVGLVFFASAIIQFVRLVRE
jgi:threonine/homoserine/homoserine lactone efflux protein